MVAEFSIDRGLSRLDRRERLQQQLRSTVSQSLRVREQLPESPATRLSVIEPKHVSGDRAQTDAVRDALRHDFDHVTLLADSLEFARTPASGFDGIGIYDNYVGPETYARYATGASRAGLVFSFNVNPGFDGIQPRAIPDCYSAPAFAPAAAALDFTRADDRERAALLSQQRISASFAYARYM